VLTPDRAVGEGDRRGAGGAKHCGPNCRNEPGTGLVQVSLAAHQLSLEGRLQDVSFRLEGGTLAALVGPNGSGKSTLLQILAGLLPARGSVELDGQELSSIPFLERGRRMTWLGQESQAEFAFPVREVVAQGRFAWGDDGRRVDGALAKLDIAHLADRVVTELSGGERRRVFLARALATAAPIQLWDEPTAGLDVRHALETLRLARELADGGAAVLVSLHDLRAAYRFDRVLVLDNGCLVGDGEPHQVLTAPLIRQVFRVEAHFTTSLVPELPVD
jgi:iron complex transport system ATP-binding protein